LSGGLKLETLFCRALVWITPDSDLKLDGESPRHNNPRSNVCEQN